MGRADLKEIDVEFLISDVISVVLIHPSWKFVNLVLENQ